MKELSATNRLIIQVIDWAMNEEGITPTGENIPTPTNRRTPDITIQLQQAAQINRPKRQAAKLHLFAMQCKQVKLLPSVQVGSSLRQHNKPWFRD